MTTVARLALILGLVGVLAAGVAIDRRADRAKAPAPLAAAHLPSAPTASPATSLSSTWYCPGGQAGPDQAADTSVVLANPTSHTIGGRLTVLPTTGDPKEVAVSVAARGQAVIRLADAYGSAVVAGATIDLDQGGVVAQETIKVPEGTVTGACASQASRTWYSPAGSTGRDADAFLAIVNPFPDDAIVDLSFATDQGGAAPAELQGIIVASQHLAVVDVGDKVRRRDFVASQVTARRGRVVVSKVQRRGPSVTTSLAAASTQPLWYFPSGARFDGLVDRLELFNPGDEDASVTIQLGLQEGAVEPQSVVVPAHDRTEVQLNANTAIPKGSGYSVTVQSADGIGIVAERTFVVSRPISAAGTFADELGLIAGAPKWVSATTSRTGNGVSILNLGLDQTSVNITVLDGAGGTVTGLEPIVVPSGDRVGISLEGKLGAPGQAIQISADQPIVVDRGGFDSGGPDSSYVAAVPLT